MSRAYGLGFRVSGFGFRDSGFGFRDYGLEFRVSGFGFRVSGLWLTVSGFGFRVSDSTDAGLFGGEIQGRAWSRWVVLLETERKEHGVSNTQL